MDGVDGQGERICLDNYGVCVLWCKNNVCAPPFMEPHSPSRELERFGGIDRDRLVTEFHVRSAPKRCNLKNRILGVGALRKMDRECEAAKIEG